jgi:signal transduction histidine kinase
MEGEAVSRDESRQARVSTPQVPGAGPAAAGSAAAAMVRHVVDALPQPALVYRDGMIVHANPAFCRLSRYPLKRLLDQPLSNYLVADSSAAAQPHEDPAARAARMTLCDSLQGSHAVDLVRCALDLPDGPAHLGQLTITPQRNWGEDALLETRDKLELLVEQRTAQLAHAKRMLEDDIGRRKQTERELLRRNDELSELNAKLSQAKEQLVQSEKLASLGQLAAGVAHEINNPIGYVQSNINALQDYLNELFGVLDLYEQASAGIAPDGRDVALELAAIREKTDLDFLREDIPRLLRESKQGISSVRKIVQGLKDFSRSGAHEEWQIADLHVGLDSTLNMVNNEIKYHAEVVKLYGALPMVECLPSQLNQVFMNLLVNAAQAIPPERPGRITIRTGAEDGWAWVEVNDTGSGIAPENLGRIFDPFFTTKPVGQGTGLGLSLSYGIIQKHNGAITVTSESGRGACFRVALPLRHNPVVAAAASFPSPT